MIIRQANESDIDTLVTLIRTSFRDVAERFALTIENCPGNPAFCTRERVKSDFEKGLIYYILENHGQPCGCAAIEKASPQVCFMERVAVLPKHRRKGYGKALVNHIFEQAGKIGAKELEVAMISENITLKNWYMKFGFVRKSTKKFDHLPFIVAFMSAEI
ncbi:MAG: GNAT family N-acetyltransferase [Sedimentisphaerales bacterium]|nr:GNAT family N-acetyltransferase [Sedimentisphaerales bacterium]